MRGDSPWERGSGSLLAGDAVQNEQHQPVDRALLCMSEGWREEAGEPLCQAGRLNLAGDGARNFNLRLIFWEESPGLGIPRRQEGVVYWKTMSVGVGRWLRGGYTAKVAGRGHSCLGVWRW